MILDTNALSAWAEGDRFIEPLLRSTTNMLVPVVVLVVTIDREVAQVYGAVRLELKKAGTPIPVNDTWIAAIARHRRRAVISKDGHFDAVSGIERVSW